MSIAEVDSEEIIEAEACARQEIPGALRIAEAVVAAQVQVPAVVKAMQVTRAEHDVRDAFVSIETPRRAKRWCNKQHLV